MNRTVYQPNPMCGCKNGMMPVQKMQNGNMVHAAVSAASCTESKQNNHIHGDDGVLAMAYVHVQRLGEIYDPCTALIAGTLFPDLDKPFCGESTITYCVDDILERVTEVSMPGLYKELRQAGVALESQSVRETLTHLCNAAIVEFLNELDAAEMPQVGTFHDFGKAVEYGNPTKRKPHRTPDSLANSQQLKLFDSDRPYGEQADEYLRDLEDRARAERSEMMEDDLGFRPFDQEA